MRITRHFFEANKPVAVVCHGVEIVAAAGVLQGGRKMTTVAKCALDITQCGGQYVQQRCVVDGNLISCGTWHDYDTEFFKLFIAQLKQLNCFDFRPFPRHTDRRLRPQHGAAASARSACRCDDGPVLNETR